MELEAAEFVINDGQHRCAAIAAALKDNPALGKEKISVLLFERENPERLQQMFSDLNRFVQKTSKESLDRCVKLKAEERTKDPGCAAVAGLLDGVQLRNETLGKLPLGWPPQPVNKVLPLPITVPVGWFLTALAISLGASFWFDFLGKLVNVRHGMRRPQAEAGDARSS